MVQQPLAEVFGFPITNVGPEAIRHRNQRLCPFGNKVPTCTKDKANNPLGVCSIFAEQQVVITCPIRFREEWLIAHDAASFFFPPGTKWTTLTEVRLKDRHGKRAGNIDIVLASYNEAGKITDFGALEVQAVYISGNVRNPFEHYMEDPLHRASMDWSGGPNYPKPDYLSSSRKRLAPQLLFKGGIFNAWNKKLAVALSKSFFETLPTLHEVDPAHADVAWLVYRLRLDSLRNVYHLHRYKTAYTDFHESLETITSSEPGDVARFIKSLQEKVDANLENRRVQDTEASDATF